MNRGCVPSKALLAASGRVRELQNSMHLKAMGIQVIILGLPARSGLSIDVLDLVYCQLLLQLMRGPVLQHAQEQVSDKLKICTTGGEREL